MPPTLNHRSPTTQVHVAAAGLFALTWLIRFLALVGFPNDHFLYLAAAQQMVAGELPSRDFVDPGLPLMYTVSAAAQLLVDSPLLAEALVVSTAFGLAAALTVYAAFLASGSLGIAVVVTIAEIALFPRSYNYPKLLLYAAGLLAMWGYARRPSPRRAVRLALSVVVAFLFRHDHGLFLGAAALLTAASAWADGESRVAGVARIFGLIALLVLPYLLYVESTIGLTRYVAAGVFFSQVEVERTMGQLPLFDVSSWQSAHNAVTALFYIFHLLPLVSLGVLVRDRIKGGSQLSSDWRFIAPLALLAIAANLAFLRDPLDSRLPDVAVPAAVLTSWLMPLAWRGRGAVSVARRGLVLATASVFFACVNAIGVPAEHIDRAGFLLGHDRLLVHARDRLVELREPFSPRQFPSRTINALVPVLEYTGRCTTAEHRLFVAGYAPEVYVFARRLFAGGQPALQSGYFVSVADQRRLVLRLRRQRAVLALIPTEGDAGLYPLVMEELRTEFRSVGEVAVDGQGTVSVLVNRRIPPTGVDAATGFPCFT